LETLKQIGEIYHVDITNMWAELAARVPNSTIDPLKMEIETLPVRSEPREDAEQEKKEIDLIFSSLVSSTELLGKEYSEAPF
jgi:hypothetical protein